MNQLIRCRLDLEIRPMRIWLLLLIAFALPVPQLTAAETWAERLGYEPSDRVVILYADNMGAAYETNRSGSKCLEEGVVQSASVMVPCPWFDHFAEWCRSNRGHDIGVSLTLKQSQQELPVAAAKFGHQLDLGRPRWILLGDASSGCTACQSRRRRGGAVPPDRKGATCGIGALPSDPCDGDDFHAARFDGCLPESR